MKKIASILIVVVLIAALTGCASGPPAQEYMAYEENGVLVQKKTPALGAVLGLLPGGGSFYAGYPAKGMLNLFTWPLSILWDPISGYKGSKTANYNFTKVTLAKNKNKEIDSLNAKRSTGEIDDKEYNFQKSEIDRKYKFD